MGEFFQSHNLDLKSLLRTKDMKLNELLRQRLD